MRHIFKYLLLLFTRLFLKFCVCVNFVVEHLTKLAEIQKLGKRRANRKWSKKMKEITIDAICTINYTHTTPIFFLAILRNIIANGHSINLFSRFLFFFSKAVLLRLSHTLNWASFEAFSPKLFRFWWFYFISYDTRSENNNWFHWISFNK